METKIFSEWRQIILFQIQDDSLTPPIDGCRIIIADHFRPFVCPFFSISVRPLWWRPFKRISLDSIHWKPCNDNVVGQVNKSVGQMAKGQLRILSNEMKGKGVRCGEYGGSGGVPRKGAFDVAVWWRTNEQVIPITISLLRIENLENPLKDNDGDEIGPDPLPSSSTPLLPLLGCHASSFMKRNADYNPKELSKIPDMHFSGVVEARSGGSEGVSRWWRRGEWVVKWPAHNGGSFFARLALNEEDANGSWRTRGTWPYGKCLIVFVHHGSSPIVHPSA